MKGKGTPLKMHGRIMDIWSSFWPCFGIVIPKLSLKHDHLFLLPEVTNLIESTL